MNGKIFLICTILVGILLLLGILSPMNAFIAEIIVAVIAFLLG